MIPQRQSLIAHYAHLLASHQADEQAIAEQLSALLTAYEEALRQTWQENRRIIPNQADANLMMLDAYSTVRMDASSILTIRQTYLVPAQMVALDAAMLVRLMTWLYQYHATRLTQITRRDRRNNPNGLR